MKTRKLAMILAVVAMVMGAMAPASAAGDKAACSDGGIYVPAQGSGWDNHGSHITGDYVHPASDGGGPADGAKGHPAHSGSGLTPGATFCNQNGQGAAHAATVGSP